VCLGVALAATIPASERREAVLSLIDDATLMSWNLAPVCAATDSDADGSELLRSLDPGAERRPDDLTWKRVAELAPALARAGRAQAALERVERIGQPLLRLKGLAGLAPHFPDRDLLGDCDAIADAPSAAEARLGLAERRSQAARTAVAEQVRPVASAALRGVPDVARSTRLPSLLAGEQIRPLIEAVISSPATWEQAEALKALARTVPADLVPGLVEPVLGSPSRTDIIPVLAPRLGPDQLEAVWASGERDGVRLAFLAAYATIGDTQAHEAATIAREQLPDLVPAVLRDLVVLLPQRLPRH
jgi:hypothetical protein